MMPKPDTPTPAASRAAAPDEVRAQFEHWYSDEGRSPTAIKRNNAGFYVLMGAHSAWRAWEACAAALEASQPASPAPLTDEQERTAFVAAMVEAGYSEPGRGMRPGSQYLYQRDEDRFVGWMLARAALASPQVAPAPEPESMLKEVEAALVFALWHHQGGSSKVGQPIRKMLGIGPHMRLNAGQIEQAKRVQAAFDVANYGSAAPVQVAPPSRPITRFNPIPGLGMNPHPAGLYVYYQDHLAAVLTPAAADDARDAAEARPPTINEEELHALQWAARASFSTWACISDEDMMSFVRCVEKRLGFPAAKPAEPTLPTQGDAK